MLESAAARAPGKTPAKEAGRVQAKVADTEPCSTPSSPEVEGVSGGHQGGMNMPAKKEAEGLLEQEVTAGDGATNGEPDST